MHDSVRLSVTLGLGPFEPFPTGTGFSLRPTNEGGYSLRDVPLRGGFAGVTYDGELVHLQASGTVQSDDAASFAEAIDAEGPINATLGFGEDVSASSMVDETRDIVLHVIRFSDGAWDQLRRLPSGLVVGLEGDNLRLLAYETAVRRPSDRRVRITARGWHAQANRWFAHMPSDGDETTGLGVSLHASAMVPTEPPPPPNPADSQVSETPETWAPQEGWEQVPSLDGRGFIQFDHEELLSLDAPATSGSVEVPSIDETVDAVELSLSWPEDPQAIIEEIDGTARARIEFGGEASHWLAVGSELIVGVADGDRLACIVIPAMQGPGPDDPMMHPGIDPTTEFAAMHEHAMTSMSEQFASEQRIADQYIAESPFQAYGPVDRPDVDHVSMRLIDGMYGPPPIGVELIWGDEMGRMMPDADPSAPLVAVRHERIVDMGLPPGMPEQHEHMHWLLGERMIREQRLITEGKSVETLVDVASSAAFDPHAHERAAAELAETATQCTVDVDGKPAEGSVVRTAEGFVAQAERDGWRWTIRSTDADGGVPALGVVSDLSDAREGLDGFHTRMQEMHAQAVAYSGMSDAPAAASEMRRAAESLLLVLQMPTNTPDPVQAFTPDVAESWGGERAFRSRFDVLRHMTNVNSHVVAVDRTGTVAFAQCTISLPRPDGAMFGMSVAFGDGWWEYDANEVRAAASVVLPPDQQQEYEITVNALLQRDADGRVVIATDVLRIVDEHVGGIERLVGSLSPPSS